MTDAGVPAGGGPIVSVRGEATLEVDPEIAILSLDVSARAQDHDKAMAALTQRTGAARAIVSGFEAGIERIETGQLWVRPEYDDKKGERVKRYIGSTSTRVVVGDFTVLSDLVLALSEVRLLSLGGPWWQLRPNSPVYRDARLAAARDAQRRAADYAAAFGAVLTGLIEVADQGMSTSGAVPEGGVRPFRASGGARFASAAQPMLDLDLDPVRQRVSGSIEARFTMSAPDLADLSAADDGPSLEDAIVDATNEVDDSATFV